MELKSYTVTKTLFWSGFVLTYRWQETTNGNIYVQPQKVFQLTSGHFGAINMTAGAIFFKTLFTSTYFKYTSIQ